MLNSSKAICYSDSYEENTLYRLTTEKQAIKTLQKMPRQNAQRIRQAMDRLAENPDRRDIDVARLEG